MNFKDGLLLTLVALLVGLQVADIAAGTTSWRTPILLCGWLLFGVVIVFNARRRSKE